MKISLHQLRDYVDVVIVCRCWRLLNIDEFNYVIVVKEFQYLYLPQHSLCVNHILKGFVYPLDGHLLASLLILC
jgi:hypothetical protein